MTTHRLADDLRHGPISLAEMHGARRAPCGGVLLAGVISVFLVWPGIAAVIVWLT